MGERGDSTGRADRFREDLTNLTKNQFLVWAGQQLEPTLPLYNLGVNFEIPLEVDRQRFEKAVRELVERNDTLATVISDSEGVPQQRVRYPAGWELAYHDLSESADPVAAARQWSRERHRELFDLGDRLFDAALLRTAPDQTVLYLSTHHIIADGYSFGLMFSQLASLYHSDCVRTRSSSPPSYASYVEYERSLRQSPCYLKTEEYWKQKLATPAPRLEFYGRPPADRFAGVHRLVCDLGVHRTTRLQTIADRMKGPSRTRDVSVFNMFAALLASYLHRISGKSELAIGASYHNRKSPKWRQTVGLMMEVIPLRVTIQPRDTFLSLIRRITDEAYESVRHTPVALANSPHDPTYDVLLNYNNLSFAPFGAAPVRAEWIPPAFSNRSLALQVRGDPHSRSLRVEFDFHQDVFQGEQRVFATEHFLQLLDSFLENPDQPIGTANLLTPEEQQYLVRECDPSWTRLPAKLLSTLVDQQAEKTPDQTAIIHQHRSLSYAELCSRANQLAHHLQSLGVGPEVPVGICMERCPDMVVALLGILKAGGAYVPIDPDWPKERASWMLRDSQAAVLVSHDRVLRGDGLGELLSRSGPRLVSIDVERGLIAAQKKTPPRLDASPDSLAYVMYTSGSSGRPKGVEIAHRAAVNFTLAAGEAYELVPGDRVLQFASLAFDTSVEEIFPALTKGATVVLRSDGMIDCASLLLANCRDLSITVLDLPTAYWNQLVAELERQSLPLPPSLRLVIIGGERALYEQWVSWRRQFGNQVRLLNTYGPTEATVVATMCDLTTLDPVDYPRGDVPIGRAIHNVQTVVLDTHLQPVPRGVAGELHIAGAALARGYRDRADLTQSKFLTTAAGDRLYATGDRVQLLPDGNLVFLGRLDRQVKIRGFRVELGEVEAALSEHPAIGQAVVCAREDNSGTKHLVAYTVGKEASPPTSDQLRDFLGRRLPDPMLPTHYVKLDRLPLTADGKVDPSRLPALKQVGQQDSDARCFDPPTGPAEQVLADIWAELLGIDLVGRLDNFFDLGGHSLLATQLVARVREVLDVDLTLRNVFETPTVAGLAELCPDQDSGCRTEPSGPILPVSAADRPPLSCSQERVWFIQQVHPSCLAYNFQVVTRLKGRLDITALQQSLNEIVRRHEVLRTTFPSVGGRPFQDVHPSYRVHLPVVDLSSLHGDRLEGELQRLIQEKVREPFDLHHLPLIRWTLFRVSPDEHVLLQVEHHLIHDGWSFHLLLDEMRQLYGAFSRGESSPLPELPIQYADYARWQRDWLRGAGAESQLQYWKKKLADSPPLLELPGDFSRPAVQGFRGNSFRLELPRDLYHALRALSRREGVTLFMTMLAAFATLLFRYTGQMDIAIGSSIANRRRRETERLIGMFINNLILRCDLTGEPSFRNLLARVRELTLEAYENQDIPAERVVEALNPKRDLSHNPLFQVTFHFQDAALPDVDVAELDWELPRHLANESAKFDLSVILVPRLEQRYGARRQGDPDGIVMIWEYSSELFREATVKRMVEHYENLLRGIVDDADRTITQLPLLSDAERDRLLVQWNQTSQQPPAERCFHQRFEDQAEQTPNAVAVSFADRQLTYGELNSEANRLAHYLRERGVGPEVPVGICVQRSLEMVIAVLGVLKAGGAYVPMDPTYPRQRLAFMLEDTAAPVLLSETGVLADLELNSTTVGEAFAATDVILMDRDREAISGGCDENPVSGVTPQNLAYVIYTSGSTGRPKGALLEHHGLSNLAVAQRDAFHLGPDDQVLQFASLSFDASILELAWAFCAGATLHLATPEELLPGPDLARFMQSRRISTVLLPPSALAVLPHQPMPYLSTLAVGGEPCPGELARRWSAGRRFFNIYGPTEATVFTTFALYEGDRRPPEIGRPIRNAQIYVLDPQMQPVPVGIAGELYIAGAGVGRGYLNCPDQTAASFIPDPFREGGRLYKTGDVVRYREDGHLEFLGRRDFQVKVRGFRIELGEIESALRSHPALGDTVVIAREDVPGRRQLVAYLTLDQQAEVATSQLRRFLKERLPAYMVPAAFVFLDKLPTTSSGKVDRAALPLPDNTRPVARRRATAPRGPAERVLCEIWQDVLRVDQVGVHDNFFELGGDSILSIQIIARANEAGLRLAPKQLFEHQTIAGLAAVAGMIAQTKADQGPVTGPVQLTPIQSWFLEADCGEKSANHFNQAMLLATKIDLDPGLLREAVGHLLVHHDALRHRFVRQGRQWRQIASPPDQSIPVELVDLSMLAESDQQDTIKRAAAKCQQSLSLADGPLLRIVHFTTGTARQDHLLLVIHHLVVDTYSWQVLLSDLQRVYQQLQQNEPLELPAKTTSFQRWASQLGEYARSADLRREFPYWLNDSTASPGLLPRDDPSGANTRASAAIVSVSLSRHETDALLHEIAPARAAKANEVVLTALAQTLMQQTGGTSLLVDIEGHGREEIVDDVDLSRTVGWFTTLFPLRLELSDSTDCGQAIKLVKEQLRAVPNRGIGYGLLRYMSGDSQIGDMLRKQPQAEVSFNYQSQSDSILSGSALFTRSRESLGPSRGRSGLRSHLLEIDARLLDGQLHVSWTYSKNVQRADTIERLARCFRGSLQALIAHGRRCKAPDYAPSDFPLARLDETTLHRILQGGRTIEDIYPLAPMQEVILGHVTASQPPNPYLIQLVYRLAGDLDVKAFERAWQHVIDRHSALRTHFAWEGLESPLQIVQKRAQLTCRQQDWRGFSSHDQQRRLDEFLEDDQARGFALDQPPLSRLELIRIADDEYRLVWSQHHIVIDGWSAPLVLQEVMKFYEAEREGKRLELPAATPYREFIARLGQHDRGASRAVWGDALNDFAGRSLIETRCRPVSTDDGHRGHQRIRLPATWTNELQATARRRRLTLATLIQGAWALLLSRYNNKDDVVFGITIARRPTELPGAQSMIGLMVNTFPLRVRVPAEQSVAAWLEELQQQQLSLQQSEYDGKLEQVGTDLPLESNLRVQNYPSGNLVATAGLEIQRLRCVDRWHHPLNVAAAPGEELELSVDYASDLFDPETIARMLSHLESLLIAIASYPDRTVAEVLSQVTLAS